MSKRDGNDTGTQEPTLEEQEVLEFEQGSALEACIKVVGVGGGGGNALNTMIQSGLGGVEFIAANTDAQALGHNLAATKVQLGAEVTRGLGCGANPDRGRASALEARERLREILEGSDMVFVTAGMGGGTGTGAAPIVAEVAREIGALTVGVVTKPFPFEGRVRQKHADRGLDDLHQVVDTLITIPNQRLLALAGKTTSMQDAFKHADDVLLNAVRGISDLITVHGLINLDFADVRTVMNEAGVAMMGTGVGLGDTRAMDAARAAISSPLLEDLSIDGARGVLINITGAGDMTLFEVNEASMLVQEAAHEEANIIFGAVVDETMPEGEVRVTVIATGLDDGRARRGIDDRQPAVEAGNVTPLRREPTPPAAEPVPAAQLPTAAPIAGGYELDAPELPPADLPVRQPEAPRGEPVRVENAVPEPAPLPAAEPIADAPSAEQIAAPEEFASPFEDELDVPAFLRRQQEDEDRDEPAFMRRAQD